MTKKVQKNPIFTIYQFATHPHPVNMIQNLCVTVLFCTLFLNINLYEICISLPLFRACDVGTDVAKRSRPKLVRELAILLLLVYKVSSLSELLDITHSLTYNIESVDYLTGLEIS